MMKKSPVKLFDVFFQSFFLAESFDEVRAYIQQTADQPADKKVEE